MLELFGFVFVLMFAIICSLVTKKKDNIKVMNIFCEGRTDIDNYIRLLIGPYCLWMAIEYIFLSENVNFMTAKLLGLGAGLIVIPSFCYSYRVITKQSYKWLDIVIYVISVMCAQMFSYQILISASVPTTVNYASLVILLILLFTYILITTTPLNSEIKKYDKPRKKGKNQ